MEGVGREEQDRGPLIAVEDTEMGLLARLIDKAFPYALFALSIGTVIGLSILIVVDINDYFFVIPAFFFIISFVFTAIVSWKTIRNNDPHALFPRVLPLKLFENGVEIPTLLQGGPEYNHETIFCHYNEIEDIRFELGVGVILIRGGNALQFHLPSMENVLPPSKIKSQWEQFKRQSEMSNPNTDGP